MREPGREPPGARRGEVPPDDERRTAERLVALLLAGGALLNFPLLSVLRDRGTIGGIPVLYAFLFLVWALLAGATALVLRERPAPPDADDDEPGPREP